MRWAGPLLTSLRTEYLADPDNGIQISYLVLPKAKSPTRFALLYIWFRWYDKSYDYNKHYIKSNTELLTRLLYVGDLDYNPDNGLQISFPVLPEAESPIRFTLLRAWLRWCDESHDCNKYYVESNTEWPTRLLYVGDPDDPDYDPDVLRLNYAT